jgi:hypothetical protein
MKNPFTRKPKFSYELYNQQNFNDYDIKSPEDLVNAVENENYRLLEASEKGAVVLAKLNKHGEAIIAQKVILPMAPNTDFDEALADFYQTKYIAFDESIFDEPEPIKQETEITETLDQPATINEPEMSSDMKKLLKQGEQLQAIEKQYEGSAEEGLTNEPEKPNSELVKQLNAMQIEMAQMRADLAEAKSQQGGKEKPAITEQIVAHSSVVDTFSEEKTEDTLLNREEVKDSHLNEIVVDNMVQEMREAVDQKLTDYVAQEKMKIQTEVKALDHRDQIAPSVTKHFESQKQSAIENLTATTKQEQKAALAKENERHEQALATIEADLQTRFETEKAEIESEISQKTSSQIQTEYEAQTKQLDSVLQGKLDELELKQQKLNQALKSNFNSALAGFNKEYQTVIELVPKNNILSLESNERVASM